MKQIIFGIFCVVFFAACAPTTLPSSQESTPTETSLSKTTPDDNEQTLSPVTRLVDTPEATLTESDSTYPPQTENEDSTKPTVTVGEVVIIYQRIGGFAGVDEQWSIYPDGRIDGPNTSHVTPEEVAMLVETIQANGFFELKNSYIPLDTCCDRFTYSISVRLDGNIKTVKTIDLSPSQPEQLTTLMNAISEMIFASE